MAGWRMDGWWMMMCCSGILCPNLRRLETVGPKIWEAACLESESECRENDFMVTWLRLVENVKLHLKKWMKVNLWSPPFPDRGWWWLMRCLQAARSPSLSIHCVQYRTGPYKEPPPATQGCLTWMYPPAQCTWLHQYLNIRFVLTCLWSEN